MHQMVSSSATRFYVRGRTDSPLTRTKASRSTTYILVISDMKTRHPRCSRRRRLRSTRIPLDYLHMCPTRPRYSSRLFRLWVPMKNVHIYHTHTRSPIIAGTMGMATTRLSRQKIDALCSSLKSCYDIWLPLSLCIKV